jgi:hypothetical protein
MGRAAADDHPMSSPAVALVLVEVLPGRPPVVDVDVDDRGRTVDVLRGLDARWTRVDHVPFGSTVDIDHVLLSAAGVFVATVVAPGDAWTLTGPGALHAIGEARWRGRKIEFLLARAGRPRVTPILIVDGPGAPAIPGGYDVVDGVLVCRLPDARRWCAHLDAQPEINQPGRVTEWIDLIADHTRRTGPAGRTRGRRHWVLNVRTD